MLLLDVVAMYIICTPYEDSISLSLPHLGYKHTFENVTLITIISYVAVYGFKKQVHS